MHFRCVIIMLKCCVLVGLDWVEPMMLLMLHITCLCIFHAYVPFFCFYHLILNCLVLFYVSLSLFLSLVALWHLNANLLHPGTLFVLGHLLLLLPPLTSLHLTSSSMMIKTVRTFWRTSNDEAFIRNAKSFYRIFTVIYSRGWESLCGIPVTCPSVII